MMDNLPGDGEAVSLAIETYVREDQLRLFGFASEEERSWLRLLMGVQGVGAKVALAIQGVLSAQDLTQAVAAEDKAMVARAPGVGPKVAQRIVQELKDKIPEAQFIATAGHKVDGEGGKVLEAALSALTNLGYQRMQANQALMAARGKLGDEADSIEALIKQALKEMV